MDRSANNMQSIPEDRNTSFNSQSIVSTLTKDFSAPNFMGWYLANTLDNVSKASIDMFMPIFARVIGASAVEIGLLSGLYTLINISQLIWAQLSSKLGQSRIFVVLGWLVSALLFIPMLLVKKGQIFLLLVLRFLQGFFTSAAAPTQASLMADHIPQDKRANKVNNFTKLGLIGALVGTICGGLLFSFLADVFRLTVDLTFIILFFWTMVLGVIASIIFFISVPDYKYLDRLDPVILTQRSIIHSEITSKTRLINRYKAYKTKFENFLVLCLFAGIFYFAVNMAAPFFIILEIEYYNFSFFQASLLTSINTFTQMVLASLLARTEMLDKYGRKVSLVIGVLLVSLSTVLVVIPYYLNVSPYLWCIFAWVILGISWGIFNPSISVFILDIAHPKYRATLIATYNTLTGITMFLGPIIGGVIIDFTQNITLTFLIRALIVILTLIVLVRIKEPVIPASLIHPPRYYFTKLLRYSAGRGPEPLLIQVIPQKLRKKHWFGIRQRIKRSN
ncbi:MAG: MFS transporter [Candidatus Hermodarchaeota archaeon]